MMSSIEAAGRNVEALSLAASRVSRTTAETGGVVIEVSAREKMEEVLQDFTE